MKTIQFIQKTHLKQDNNEIKICGWVTSSRGNKNIHFLKINDGSTFYNLQVVLKKNILENFTKLEKVKIGSSILIHGKIINTPQKKEQKFEVIADKFKVFTETTDKYPIQKQNTSLEYLREIPHFRHHTSYFRAIMKIRSILMFELHSFFNKENFMYFSNPIITGNDGEGAGESFKINANKNKNFFGIESTLCVTGQLHAEAYANGFKKVYTFGPTFRAENSHTRKHLAEFWMLEPEVAFFDLNKIIELSDKMLKTVIKNTIKKATLELEYLESKTKKPLIKNLEKFISTKIKEIEYADAITILEKNKDKFINQKIKFGLDMDTEHERFLVEDFFKEPIVVRNYPKEIKAFYMFQNSDNKTVAAFDTLFPEVGELIGGSQREANINKLVNRITELGIDESQFKWYTDLRREGSPGSSGFGLGFERLVMYVTGASNIKDVIPFPRTPNSLFA